MELNSTVETKRYAADSMKNAEKQEVQNAGRQLQAEMLKQTSAGTVPGSNMQKEMLQLVSAFQPVQQVQQAAQAQLKTGHLDIKV